MPPAVRRQLSDPNRGYNYQSRAQPGELGLAAGPRDACTWTGGISLQVGVRGGRCDKPVSSAGICRIRLEDARRDPCRGGRAPPRYGPRDSE